MKFFIITLAIGLLFSYSSSAAVLITSTGSIATNEKKSDGTTAIPVGNAFVLVVDTGAAGFAESSTNTIAANSTFNVGDLLSGDTIIYRATNTLLGRSSNNMSNLDLTAYAGKQFGLLWFDTAVAATTNLADGDKYGFVTDPTWFIPSVSGTYGFNTTTSTANPFLTNTAPGGTTLTVGLAAIPEPSRTLLFGLGLLGLIAHRRRKA